MTGRGEIIAIGSELTSGLVAESNAAAVARVLLGAGLEVAAITCIGDEPEAIADALARALSRSAFVVVTGGLGPTDDDLTTQVAAGALGRELIFDPGFLSHVEGFFRAQGLRVSRDMRKLAQVPEGAFFLDPEGQTCGYYLEQEGKLVFFLPGVPAEAGRLAAEKVLPLLEEAWPERPSLRRLTLKIFGLAEFDISELVETVRRRQVSFSFLPVFPGHLLVLTAQGAEAAEVERRLSEVEGEVRRRLGWSVYGQGEDALESVVGGLLRQKGSTLSLAESCTGGLIGHLITEVPGSSDYLERGLVTYSNRAKVELLGVPQEVIDRHGAVSQECATAMAQGVRGRTGTDLGLSVTGIAGPTGGSREKPVGTVWFGLAEKSGVSTLHRRFRGGRSEVKLQAAWTALDWLRRRLSGAPDVG